MSSAMEIASQDEQETEQETESLYGSQDDGVNLQGVLDGCSQSQPDEPPYYWGRLYPLDPALATCDLIQDDITFGKVKPDCNFVIRRSQLPKEVYSKCSRVHFQITRKQILFSGALTTKVEITDRSSNGTYINGHVLFKKTRVLKHNDMIGFPTVKASYDAYVFIDSLAPSEQSIPREVRQRYLTSRYLGSGAFGEVILVFDKESHSPLAMKTIIQDAYANDFKDERTKRKLLNEVKILKTVKHPNVIQLVDVIDGRNQNFLFLEYMRGKDLAQRFKGNQISEDLAKLYFYQIAKGVEYLHRNGITHRDLKPANILLASMDLETVVKITDFGLSKLLSSATVMKTVCGTKMYVAPEVLCGGGIYEYTNQVDVWSMGIILYACLSGMEPFSTDSDLIEEQIKSAKYTFTGDIWSRISSPAKRLIDRMLVRNPNERITVTEILDESWLHDEKMLQRVNELLCKKIDTSPLNCDSSSMESGIFYNNEDVLFNQTRSLSPPTKKLRL